MKKSQIALILGAVVFVIVLFQLPKALVKNNKQAPMAPSQSDSVAAIPSLEVSPENKKLIAELTNLMNSVTIPQKKLNFADSLANLYRRLHRFDSAAVLSEMAASLMPSEKRTIQAGQDYYEAFQIASENDKPVYQKKAQTYFLDVLKKNPNNLDVKVDLAMTYVSSETPMQGITLLREVVETDPKNQKAIFQLGILSIQSTQFDKAVKRFDDLLKLNPSHTLGNFYMGVALMGAGEPSKAKEYLLKAKSLDSDSEFQAIVDSKLNEIK